MQKQSQSDLVKCEEIDKHPIKLYTCSVQILILRRFFNIYLKFYLFTSSLVPGRFLRKAGLCSVEVEVIGEEIEVSEEEEVLFGSLEGTMFDIFHRNRNKL